MFRSSLRLLAGLSLLAITGAGEPALAQENEDGLTRLVLSERAVREVEQNTLVVTVTARSVAKSPSEAQAAVNEAMSAALVKARNVAGVELATGRYRVYEERDADGNPRAWVAEQELHLRAQEAPPLLELAGSLQQAGLAMTALDYVLSAGARQGLEDELTTQALAALRDRVEKVAQDLDMTIARLAVLRLGSVENPPMPMMRANMAMSEAAAPPVAVPSTEEVSVTVEAEVLLAAR
jgi:predicted secreted protein